MNNSVTADCGNIVRSVQSIYNVTTLYLVYSVTKNISKHRGKRKFTYIILYIRIYNMSSAGSIKAVILS